MDFIDIYHIDFRQEYPACDFEQLNQSEQKMALNIANRERRGSFIKSRALLRYLLSQHTGYEARDLHLSCNEFGKPELSYPGSVYFNLSHSGDRALIAISETEVGVDLEKVDSRVRYENVAGLFFSQKEQTYLNRSTHTQKRNTFFDIWTRKEAYLKARGMGFSANPELISVHSEDGLVEDYSEKQSDTQWYVKSIDIQEGYRASFSTSVTFPRIRHIDLLGKDCLESPAF